MSRERCRDRCPDRNRCDFVTKEGEWFQPCPLPKGVSRRPNDCYGASAELALERQDVTYSEGFANCVGVFEGMPMQHASCVDAEGRVIDRAWGYMPDAAYLGIRISTWIVARRVKETGAYDSIIWPRGAWSAAWLGDERAWAPWPWLAATARLLRSGGELA